MYLIISSRLNILTFTRRNDSFIFNKHFILVRVMVDLNPVPGTLCAMKEYTPGGIPAHFRVQCTHTHRLNHTSGQFRVTNPVAIFVRGKTNPREPTYEARHLH